MADEPRGEEAALVAVQSALADRPGVLAGARALSHFGEHSIGWVAVSALGALLQPRRRKAWLVAGAGAFIAHAAAVVIKRVVQREPGQPQRHPQRHEGAEPGPHAAVGPPRLHAPPGAAKPQAVSINAPTMPACRKPEYWPASARQGMLISTCPAPALSTSMPK